jgi:8-oxo-dGTP pyrophosphatase MutT (NUDIX family)
MRFEEAAERLARLPDRIASPAPAASAALAGRRWRLPPGPASLMPVFSDSRPRTELRLGQVAGDRPAAVLVLVAPGRDGSAVVILTERATYDGVHSGEVSFPGGKVEPEDPDLEATALREAAEEVGLDGGAAQVEVLGRLDELRIPVSRFSISPILAVARVRPSLEPAPAEVARIIEAPLAAFLPGAPIEIVERQVREWPLRYGGYRIEGLHVWGATARILGQLGAVIAALGVDESG